MFHTGHLVEALRGHVEILDFKLLDTLTKDAIHFAHVNKFVVDFVDTASSWLLVHISGLLGGGLIFTMLRRGCTSVFRCAACTCSKFAMQCVAHFNFSLGLLREHALQLVRVSLEDTLYKLQPLSQLLVLDLKLSILGVFLVTVTFHFLYVLSELSVGFQQFCYGIN